MTPADADDRLATILAGMTDDVRQGRTPDVNALANEHPDLADDLRMLWAAVLVAEGVAADGLSRVAVDASDLTSPHLSGSASDAVT